MLSVPTDVEEYEERLLLPRQLEDAMAFRLATYSLGELFGQSKAFECGDFYHIAKSIFKIIT